jgi:hypothetical protein
MQALEVRRVKSSEDLLNPGEYVFIPARPPEITRYKKPIVAPVGFWKRFRWALFSKDYEIVETKNETWPPVDSVIIVCPQCSVPFASSKQHTVLSQEPLTISQPLTCPYTRDVTFDVVLGKLTFTNAPAVA